MIGKSGQSSSEILGVAILSLAMLVFVLSATLERNSETDRIANAGMNNVQCNSISETIGNVYNNRAATEQALLVEKSASIQRSGSGPGIIRVGTVSCYYSGVVENEGAGVQLSEYTEYKFSKQDGWVSICEMPC
ncbi:MAG: hypothetical protein NTW59_00025 [Candidatus Diapherotrites archaeon]|nr:hypothetical protein [Candidatus Diapherotrites archaeon]